MEKDFMDKALERDEETIRTMFSRAANRYDMLNHLLSFSLDIRWRQALVRRSRFLEYGDCPYILDLCTGTGDMIFEFMKNPQFKGNAIGLDFADPMLEIARKKAEGFEVSDRVEFINGNALKIPFKDNSFEIVTIVFGLRNLSELDKGLHEILRVLKPGGRFLSLEFYRPTSNYMNGLSSWYITKVIPIIGKFITGERGAYDYLPESRMKFLSAKEFSDKMKDIGFIKISQWFMDFHVVTLHKGEKY